MPGNWRAFVLRRLLGRLRLGDDILRHLSSLQRLGATLEAAPPLEMLPVGARTVLRAVRTRAAADIRPDWVWPFWLERQLDPDDPAFTPRGHLPVLHNVTHRNWTAVGNPWSPWEATVDPRGLVTAGADTFSLDWWVLAGGRWHLPSRAPAVEQELVGAAPVVETRLPLPTGHGVQRVYAVETVPELVVVEVANRTRERFELAFALRPYDPEGLTVVQDIRLDGRVVSVHGRPALYLPERPARTVLTTFAEGESAGWLAAGGGDGPGGGVGPGAAGRREVEDPSGLAQGAFVLPVAAGDSVRVALPLPAQRRFQRFPTPWRRRMRAREPDLRGLPAAAGVAADWDARLRRGLHVELPDERLQRAVDANRAHLLVLHDPGSITPGPSTYHRFWFRDAAYQVAALDRWGFHAEAADVLRSYPARQRPDGYFYSQWREWDANGTAIWTIAEHDRLTGDADLLHELAPSVRRGARWIERMLADDGGKVPEARGLLPPGISAEHFGPFDYYYWDDLWAWRGLLDAAGSARRTGRSALAADFTEAAARLRRTLMASFERVAARTGVRVMTAGPTRGVDAAMVGTLVACHPLELLDAGDEWVAATAATVRERFTRGEAFFQSIAHTGLGTYLTLQLAFVELLEGDERCFDRLGWLLDAATPTFTWPEAVHPRLPGGCMGDGHHGWMAADLLNFVRALLVTEDDGGLRVLPLLPPGWRGRRVAVRDAPTRHGTVSYEVGWEADRPRLRWQCRRGGVLLSAPGLDPAWSTRQPSGDVLLPAASDGASSAPYSASRSSTPSPSSPPSTGSRPPG